MGVVWKARDEETGQIVALKLLRETYAEDPDYVVRFERELELAKRIHSHNVVQVLGYGVRDGIPYLALEYVDGPSLRERLTSHGPYDWPTAKGLLAQITQGLADAHAAGVIHRDLKPSNVLIGSDGVAKIADFGIAKGIDLTRVTGTSTLLGTPAYLPPEGPVDERSDLYSLGVIAYEILTGVVPFEGRTYQEVILRHVREAPNLERLPAAARPIVGRLLAKDPKKRPQSAKDLSAGLVEKRRGSIDTGSTIESVALESSSAGLPPLGLEDARSYAAVESRGRPSRMVLAVAAVLGLTILFASGATLLSVLPPARTPLPSELAGIGGRNALASGAPALSMAVGDPGSAVPSGPAGQGSIVPSGLTVSSDPNAGTRSSVAPALGSTGPEAPTTAVAASPRPASSATPTPTPTPTAKPSQAGAYVSGFVTASEGGPLAGIAVTACQEGGSCYQTRSQADGSYSMGPVPPGRYNEQFSDPAGQRAYVRYTSAGIMISDDYSALAEFDVAASGASGINVAIPLGYRVSGTLTAAPGNVTPTNIQVGLCPPNGGGSTAVGCTNAVLLKGGGTYSVANAVPAGDYVLEVINADTWQYVYWSTSGLVADMGSATIITITSSGIGGIDGQLPW
jgi:serine/threonine-protein kinase